LIFLTVITSGIKVKKSSIKIGAITPIDRRNGKLPEMGPPGFVVVDVGAVVVVVVVVDVVVVEVEVPPVVKVLSVPSTYKLVPYRTIAWKW
jgi:hypothetical protein